jgi:hypothetical protein
MKALRAVIGSELLQNTVLVEDVIVQVFAAGLRAPLLLCKADICLDNVSCRTNCRNTSGGICDCREEDV